MLRTLHYSEGRSREIIESHLSAGRPERALAELTPVDLARFFGNFRRFENRGGRLPPPAGAGLPGHPPPRVTALMPWFRMSSEVWIVTSLTKENVERVCPEAIAGPLEALRWAAANVIEERFRLPHLRYGVIVFAGLGYAPPDGCDLDLIWRAWQAPVFVQFRGVYGEMLAAECEAHSGLHVRPDEAIFESRPDLHPELLVTSLRNLRYPVARLATGMTATLEHAPCGCGLATPRLRLLRLAEHSAHFLPVR
jgi:hypothetical protein